MGKYTTYYFLKFLRKNFFYKVINHFIPTHNFRISKSDLTARPILHNKKQAIEMHILIYFTALAIAKYVEIKTNKSIKSIIKTLKKSADAIIYNPLTKKRISN